MIHNSSVINNPLVGSNALIGRKEELFKLFQCIRERKNVHIYGPEGIGKSVLLDWAYDNWQVIDDSQIPIYCRSSRTLRQVLLYITAFLLDYFKCLESVDKFKEVKEIEYASDIKKLNIRTMRNLAYSYLPRDRFCIILDHLEYVTPRVNGLLSVLYEKTLVISASRQSWELTDYSFWGNLEYCLNLTPKIRIENLPRKEVFLLMKSIAGDSFEADDSFFEYVYRITKGNAGMTKNIITKAMMPKYRVDGCINLKLILLDLKIDNLGQTCLITNKLLRSLD
ncbi:MAG: hypothetical protein ACLQF0_14140 [Dissulfurispiraceae bacterium]